MDEKPKKFFTYEQQIQHLKDKNLIIEDEESAIQSLKRYSYYASISAYKDIFKKCRNGDYKDGTKFSHVMTLYSLDRYLRDTFLHHILIVENRMKSLYGYAFCSLYGGKQSDYLNANNYNYLRYQKYINEYLSIVMDQLKYPQREHIRYNQENYGEVPFWVLIHVFTFGNISKMYSFSLHPLQSMIAREFGADVYPKQLISMLQVLSRFRNICAHGERLYSYRTRELIEDMPIHKSLGIQKKSTEYVCGKRDLFAVMICLKYLLSPSEFQTFVVQLQSILDMFYNQLPTDIVRLIQNHMGFPENWTDIAKK